MARLTGHSIPVEYTPLTVSGGIKVEGGALAQFYDGKNYLPNREGVPASPIVLQHIVDIIDTDNMVNAFSKATTFYENNTPITSDSSGYHLLPPDSLRVEKNIPAGQEVRISAVTEFLDPRTNRYYSREDSVLLRTILRAEGLYQLELSPRSRQVFDAYRKPNKTVAINLKLSKSDTEITDFTGLIIKWLNSAGLPVVENELYALEVQNSNRRLVVDLSFIENEVINCEIWKGSEIIARDTVTFARRYNSFRSDIEIPEIPIMPGTRQLTADLYLDDYQGEIDVDEAFDVRWILNTAGSEQEVGTGSGTIVPLSRLDLAKSLSLYPDIKRRQAWGVLTDKDNKVLTQGDGTPLAFQLLGK